MNITINYEEICGTWHCLACVDGKQYHECHSNVVNAFGMLVTQIGWAAPVTFPPTVNPFINVYQRALAASQMYQ